jgi:hypothetical protein
MAVSGISSASFSAASQHAAQSPSHHKHGGHRPQSLTDIDAAGSSVASAPSTTGKIGSKVDIAA